MAKPVTEEELQLKKRARRRLVGAVALVAVVAAVLPMVLDSEPKPTSRDINIRIPSPDVQLPAKAPVKGAAKAEVASPARIEPAPSEKQEAPVMPAESKPVEKAAEKAPEKAAEKKAPEKKAAETAAEKTPEKAPEKSSAAKSAGKFYIQVAAVADVEKAKQVRDQIQGAGVRAYTEEVAAANGRVTRVRAGPFATREEAEQARAQLSLAGLEGKIAGN